MSRYQTLARTSLVLLASLTFACDPAAPSGEEQAPVASTSAALSSACTPITNLYNSMRAPLQLALAKADADVAAHPGYYYSICNREPINNALTQYNAMAAEVPQAAAGLPGYASNVSGGAQKIVAWLQDASWCANVSAINNRVGSNGNALAYDSYVAAAQVRAAASELAIQAGRCYMDAYGPY